MARLSPVNMPQAPYTDAPVSDEDSFDLLRKMREDRQGVRDEKRDEFDLANMAEDRDFELKKREAELRQTEAKTQEIRANSRRLSMESDMRAQKARDTVDAFKGFDLDVLPEGLRAEAEQLNGMLMGPLSEQDELMLAGRIQAVRRKIRTHGLQVDAGVDLSTANQLRYEGEAVDEDMQALMADLDMIQNGTYAGMDEDARTKFEEEMAKHSAAVRTWSENRRTLNRTVTQRQEWQTKLEGIQSDVLRIGAYSGTEGQPALAEKYAKTFEAFQAEVDKLKGGGFSGLSGMTYGDMQRTFNNIEMQYNHLIRIADGQDGQYNNLADQFENSLLQAAGIQKQYDEMQDNIAWMSSLAQMDGSSPYKATAMQFLGPDMADLYSERWDEGSVWENTVEPVRDQIKRMQAVYAQQNGGKQLSTTEAAMMLHQQHGAHEAMDSQLSDLVGSDLSEDPRPAVDQARDEVLLIESFAQTMPDRKLTPYSGYLDPTVDTMLNSGSPHELPQGMQDRIGKALIEAFPEYAKMEGTDRGAEDGGLAFMDPRGLAGGRTAPTSTGKRNKADVAAEVFGYDNATGETSDFPIMMWLAERASQGDAERAKVAKFLSIVAKEPYTEQPRFGSEQPKTREVAGPPMDASTDAPQLMDPVSGRPLKDMLAEEPKQEQAEGAGKSRRRRRR